MQTGRGFWDRAAKGGDEGRLGEDCTGEKFLGNYADGIIRHRALARRSRQKCALRPAAAEDREYDSVVGHVWSPSVL
jgi:hypothetical protein